jgi:hypothetical protein
VLPRDPGSKTRSRLASGARLKPEPGLQLEGHRRSGIEYDDECSFEDMVPKLIHQIAAGPQNVTLMLRRDATPERILEVLHRRTRISGKWQVVITDEGDVKKGTPRKVLLVPVSEITVPKSLPTELIEARVFFGTLEPALRAAVRCSQVPRWGHTK